MTRSQRPIRPLRGVATGLGLLLAAGCSPHYALTDPDSGSIYLTRSYDRNGSAVSFKDRVTRQRRTVENPGITEIGDDEYDALLRRLRAEAKQAD